MPGTRLNSPSSPPTPPGSCPASTSRPEAPGSASRSRPPSTAPSALRPSQTTQRRSRPHRDPRGATSPAPSSTRRSTRLSPAKPSQSTRSSSTSTRSSDQGRLCRLQPPRRPSRLPCARRLRRLPAPVRRRRARHPPRLHLEPRDALQARPRPRRHWHGGARPRPEQRDARGRGGRARVAKGQVRGAAVERAARRAQEEVDRRGLSAEEAEERLVEGLYEALRCVCLQRSSSAPLTPAVSCSQYFAPCTDTAPRPPPPHCPRPPALL